LRVSREPSDPGFDPDGHYTVYLDGVIWPNVVTADSDEGLIVVIAETPQGLELQEHRGHVTITS
jgi:hypothetical protein